MKILSRRSTPHVTAPNADGEAKAGSLADIQMGPKSVQLPGADHANIKVDVAATHDSAVYIAGWRLGPVELGLLVDGVPCAATLHVTDRYDVNEHFGVSKDRALGVVLVAELPPGWKNVQLQWLDSSGVSLGNSEALALVALDSVSADDPSLGAIRGVMARHLEPFTPEWRVATAVPSVPGADAAKGFLEAAVTIAETGHVVACGWVVVETGGMAWLEDEAGNAYALDESCWRPRQDVYASVGASMGSSALRSGFVVLVEAPGVVTRLRLKALTSKGVHELGEILPHRLPPDPASVSRWLFGIQIHGDMFWQRFERVSGPLLQSLIERSQRAWAGLPVTVRRLGPEIRNPTVSIVVPLYGRFDFVENQMVEWARDPWIRQNAELLYVVDDPSMAEAFRPHAEELWRLYQIPFRWVWGSVNRGFSGANNLGASYAMGELLLFLNSDVFPQAPGWLQQMVQVLEARPDVGAVAPRLLFAEGGIQHAGMQFDYMNEYGVWINRHPYMGLDPALDPQQELTMVPAVTGACLLVRRRDYDAVDGWDTGYLVGDFEDSDLCLKLRSNGQQIAYLPNVQLTHLERQSFVALGSGDYRQRVTLWNALRHQDRWSSILQAGEKNQ